MAANFHEAGREANSKFFNYYPHHVLPDLNWNENMDLSDYTFREAFPYSCYLPIPLMSTPKPVNDLPVRGKDPVLTLVKEKLQWNYDLKLHTNYFTKNNNVKHLEKLLKDAKQNGSASFKPREADFLKLFSKNPDEYFDGVYNWYYTGGCMNKVELNDAMVVVIAQGKKMDQVGALSLKTGKRWKVDSNISTATTPAPNSPIYEICCEKVYGKGIVGIRVRNGCYIYSLPSLQRMEFLHSAVSSIPFTSLAISKYSEGRYCTVSAERQVHVWDSGADSQIFSITVPKPKKNLPDKWSCIRWSSSRYLIMADRHYIQIVDIRKKDITELFSPGKDSNLLQQCEMISLICPSSVSSTAIYVTTSHQVLLYDTRNSSKPLQQWTHLLKAPPLYGNTVSIGDRKEAVCFVNQELGETSMFLNSWCAEQSYNEHSVVALPNMSDALRAAHRQGVWLDPVIQQRVKLSWTGATWLPPHKSKVTLLTMNSAGDVFSQILKPRKEDQHSYGSSSEDIVVNHYSTSGLKCLKNWEKDMVKRKRSLTLKATRRVKMKHVFKSLKNSSFVMSKSENENYDADCDETAWWKISKAEMLCYKDVMASVLLQAWEIDDEDEWHADKEMSSEVVPENSPTAAQKVEAWLNLSSQNSGLPASENKEKSRRAFMQNNLESAQVNEFPYAPSETQNETVSHLAAEVEYSSMPQSSKSILNSRIPNVCSQIFATSTPCASQDVLSQDIFSSLPFSMQSQMDVFPSSQNTTLSLKRTGKTVVKKEHISGF